MNVAFVADPSLVYSISNPDSNPFKRKSAIAFFL